MRKLEDAAPERQRDRGDRNATPIQENTVWVKNCNGKGQQAVLSVREECMQSPLIQTATATGHATLGNPRVELREVILRLCRLNG